MGIFFKSQKEAFVHFSSLQFTAAPQLILFVFSVLTVIAAELPCNALLREYGFLGKLLHTLLNKCKHKRKFLSFCRFWVLIFFGLAMSKSVEINFLNGDNNSESKIYTVGSDGKSYIQCLVATIQQAQEETNHVLTQVIEKGNKANDDTHQSKRLKNE